MISLSMCSNVHLGLCIYSNGLKSSSLLAVSINVNIIADIYSAVQSEKVLR